MRKRSELLCASTQCAPAAMAASAKSWRLTVDAGRRSPKPAAARAARAWAFGHPRFFRPPPVGLKGLVQSEQMFGVKEQLSAKRPYQRTGKWGTSLAVRLSHLFTARSRNASRTLSWRHVRPFIRVGDCTVCELNRIGGLAPGESLATVFLISEQPTGVSRATGTSMDVRLLRPGRQRPRCRCAAEQSDELAASRSITSSAIESSFGDLFGTGLERVQCETQCLRGRLRFGGLI